jgi:hypothetical protein
VTRGVAIVGVVLCAVPAPGCKHSSSKSFHGRALDICARYRQKEKHVTGPSELGQEVVLLRSELRDLRELRPPPSERATYRRWLAAVDGLAGALDRARVVLARDEAHVEAALRKKKFPTRKLTPAELEHPTEAILTQTLGTLPEWRTFLRDMNQVLRAEKRPGLQVVLLGRRLRLQDCVT